MADSRRDLADLVSDALGLLADESARGVVYEGPATALADVAPAVEQGNAGWATLAASARSRADQTTERGAAGLRAIRQDLGDCRRCRLCVGRSQLVFGVGHPEADLVVIGDGPDRDEDRRGEPFVGPSGEMLDKMLAHVLGLSRAQVYLSGVLKCRTPEDRAAHTDEVAMCRPFLERQLKALAPKVILVMGNVAMRSLLRTSDGIRDARGTWREWQGVPVMPTFHPRYLLRKQTEKRSTFEDLKQVRARYDALGGRR